MKPTQLSLMIASALMLAGCGGSGSDAPRNDNSTAEVVEPEKPQLPESTQVLVTVLDGDKDITSKVSLTVLEDASALVTKVEGHTLVIDQTKLVDINQDALVDVPQGLTLVLEAEGYLSQRTTVTVSEYGDNAHHISMTAMVAETLKSQGIAVKETELTLAESERNEDGLIEVAADKDAALTTQVALSPETVFIADDGEQIEADTVTVKQIGYAADSEELPVLNAEKPANIEDYNAAMKTSMGEEGADTISAGQEISFDSLGVVDIKVTAGDKNISTLLGDQPMQVSIAVPAGATGPQGDVLKAGDKVPVWSLSAKQSNWAFEQLATLEAASGNTLSATFTTTHLTKFNLAYAKPSQTCSGFIYVKDEEGNAFSHRGEFLMENKRYREEDVYRGGHDGRIDYHKVPAEKTAISFLSKHDNVVIVPELTTVNFKADEGTDIHNVLPNVDLCKSSGTTLTLKQSQAIPTVTIETAAERRNRVTEGEEAQSQTIKLRLENPWDKPVEVQYRVYAEYGADDGEDFIGRNDTITLSQSQPEAELKVDILDDAVPEMYQQRIKATIWVRDGIAFTQGGNYKRYDYIIEDNDVIKVESVDVESVSEGEPLVATVKLNQKLPQGVSGYLHYELDAKGAHTATPLADFKQSQSSYRKQGSSSTVWLREGQQELRIEIPTYDDADVEPNSESFTLKLSPSDAIEVDPSALETELVIKGDADQVGTPTTLSIDAYDTHFKEGQYEFITLRLDKAAQHPLSVDLASTIGDRLMIGDDEAESMTVTFNVGEATKVVRLKAKEDRDRQAKVSDVLRVTAPESLSVEQETISLSDNDYAYVKLALSRSQFSVKEDSQRKVTWDFNYSSTYGNGELSALTITPDQSYGQATEGDDYSVTGLEVMTLSDQLRQHQMVFDIHADTEVESNEYVGLRFSGTLPEDENVRYTLPGRSHYYYPGNTFSFSRSMLISNDDIFAFATPKRQLFKLAAASDNETFAATTLTDGFVIKTNGDLDFDVVFDVELMESNRHAMPYLTLAQEQLVLARGERVAGLDLHLAATTASDIGLKAGDNKTLKSRLKLTLTDESLAMLKRHNVEFVVTHADIAFDFMYGTEASLPKGTGATGGSSTNGND